MHKVLLLTLYVAWFNLSSSSVGIILTKKKREVLFVFRCGTGEIQHNIQALAEIIYVLFLLFGF